MFKHSNIFFSYQVHPDEILDSTVIDEVDLVFIHDYAPVPTKFIKNIEKFCPLNGAESITDACGQCRRCFDGTLGSLPSTANT